MKNLTWQNPEQLFVAQELINKVKSKCCGIKVFQYINGKFHNPASQIIELSKLLMKGELRDTKSIFCSMVLRLMDTEEYSNNYCKSLDLVLRLFPEIDGELLEKELDKYI